MSISNILLIVTIVVSFSAFNKDRMLFYKLLFNPVLIRNKKEYYRFFTYAFIHADYLHLAVNAFVLYQFGNAVESIFILIKGKMGILFYLLMYLSATFASIIPTFEKQKHNSSYNAVGASGAVSALVMSFILLNPFAEMGFLFIPIYFPAWVFGLLYLIYSYYMSKKNLDNIGHDVHLFGGLYGIVITYIIYPDCFKNIINML